VEQVRAEKGLPKEREVIKSNMVASGLNLKIGGKQNYEILEEIRGLNIGVATQILEELMKERTFIYDEIEENPINYAKWLFENQGERLFSNNNRLFIVLASEKTIEKPWWMKANFDALQEKIHHFLEHRLNSSIVDISYRYDKTPEFRGDYTAKGGIILLRE
ncbi:MAG: hypothetical protein ACTSU5_00770, partial [Promethearchaeota archaeon]